MRRRLSIAISLVGSPRVVNLDEPTTGLDPSTRHEIWGLVSSFASPERAVIITTHQMIEADTLCSRIAIISKGKLKVVGTQQHLKVVICITCLPYKCILISLLIMLLQCITLCAG